jgi:hypothetical protein
MDNKMKICPSADICFGRKTMNRHCPHANPHEEGDQCQRKCKDGVRCVDFDLLKYMNEIAATKDVKQNE